METVGYPLSQPVYLDGGVCCCIHRVKDNLFHKTNHDKSSNVVWASANMSPKPWSTSSPLSGSLWLCCCKAPAFNPSTSIQCSSSSSSDISSWSIRDGIWSLLSFSGLHDVTACLCSTTADWPFSQVTCGSTEAAVTAEQTQAKQALRNLVPASVMEQMKVSAPPHGQGRTKPKRKVLAASQMQQMSSAICCWSENVFLGFFWNDFSTVNSRATFCWVLRLRSDKDWIGLWWSFGR